MTTPFTQWTAVSLDPYGVPAEPRHGHRPGQPPLAGVHRARCGEEWEAIRVLAVDGQRALHQLGQNVGPVVASIYHGSWTFLIDKQPALGWNLHGVRLLRRGTVIELPLPGARRGGRDVRWVIPPGGLTDPALLHQALSSHTPGPPTRSGSAKPRPAPAGARPRQAGKAVTQPAAEHPRPPTRGDRSARVALPFPGATQPPNRVSGHGRVNRTPPSEPPAQLPQDR
ncbi:hypothetical protein [Streptomyces syringium]|uniref:hypothetical protein n=1 Tax=Streptomyces syringium TaxID=76729 RepID=UPI0037D468F1